MRDVGSGNGYIGGFDDALSSSGELASLSKLNERSTGVSAQLEDLLDDGEGRQAVLQKPKATRYRVIDDYFEGGWRDEEIASDGRAKIAQTQEAMDVNDTKEKGRETHGLVGREEDVIREEEDEGFAASPPPRSRTWNTPELMRQRCGGGDYGAWNLLSEPSLMGLKM